MSYKIEIEQDNDPINPRQDFDNLGTMVCFHGSYNLGDDIPDFISGVDGFKEFLEREDVFSLPLYLYDHSGITMNTTGFSCPWDSGQVGAIFVTKDSIIKEYGEASLENIETAMKVLEGEVKTYDQYITGDIWGYRIVEVDEDDEEIDQVDSCWGYFGEEDCREQAEEALKTWEKSAA